jgi:hypothetical protein
VRCVSRYAFLETEIVCSSFAACNTGAFRSRIGTSDTQFGLDEDTE